MANLTIIGYQSYGSLIEEQARWPVKFHVRDFMVEDLVVKFEGTLLINFVIVGGKILWIILLQYLISLMTMLNTRCSNIFLKKVIVNLFDFLVHVREGLFIYGGTR